MNLSLSNIGKRYNYDWVFRKLNFTFEAGNSYAILGPNGSGKSTLLQIIAGSLTSSEGTLDYKIDDKPVGKDNIFQYLSFAAPYLELIEEFTLKEFLLFHQKFKPFIKDVSLEEIAATVHLEKAFNKQIRYYSSGMKQRVKLAQAVFSDRPLLLLDEPCSNLDEEGIRVYQNLLKKYTHNRLLVISSNNPQEYEGCSEFLRIRDFK